MKMKKSHTLLLQVSLTLFPNPLDSLQCHNNRVHHFSLLCEETNPNFHFSLVDSILPPLRHNELKQNLEVQFDVSTFL